MPEKRRTTDHTVALSVEVGSSQATIALVDRAGRVRQRRYAKMLWNRPPATTLEPCLRVIDTVLCDARSDGLSVRGLGFALPGSLDLTSRRPTIIPALPALTNFPLADLLEARYKLPALLSVDVDAAALGEYYFGTGRGFRRLLLLSANAVVGASLVIDGQIEPAPQEYVGHICHLPVAGSGPRCSCGKRGCINTLVTLDALRKNLQRALRRGEVSSLLRRLTSGELFSLQLLAEEAQAGDAVASQMYAEVNRWLFVAAARYIDIFEPNALVLGGIFSASKLLLSSIRDSLSSGTSSARVCSMVEVAAATLGRDAPLLGAAVSLFS